jgi:hypothetical protein
MSLSQDSTTELAMDDLKPDHTLLFSHLDPEIFSQPQCEQFLSELLVASLLQKEVLLLAADLVTNRILAEYLCQEHATWKVVEDIIENSSAITLVIHPLHHYPLECDIDPLIFPLKAWAWMVEHTRLFGSETFQPTATQRTFYDKVDAAFSRSDRIRPSSQLPTPATNSFAFYFSTILNQFDQLTTQVPEFSVLSRDVARRYQDFARSDHAWKNALAEKDALPKSLEQTGFFRSAAYRCLRLFPMSEKESLAWKSLFQSVFYSDFCTNIGVVGRFGGRLHDLPLDFSIASEREASELLQSSIAIAGGRNLRLGRGLGEALCRTRKDLRIYEEDPLRSVWTSALPEKQFAEIWSTIVGTLGAHIGAQESPVELKTMLGIWKVAGGTGETIGALIRAGVPILNFLKSGYRRLRIEHEVREQLMGIASARAVLLTRSFSKLDPL